MILFLDFDGTLAELASRTEAELPPCTESALQMVNRIRALKATAVGSLVVIRHGAGVETRYAHLSALALDDVALPLAHGQSMTKPSVVGRVLTALQPQEGETILEIGTGSGFQAAVMASLADETPEGRSILAFARERYGVTAELPADATIIPFTAQTRLSGALAATMRYAIWRAPANTRASRCSPCSRTARASSSTPSGRWPSSTTCRA